MKAYNSDLETSFNGDNDRPLRRVIPPTTSYTTIITSKLGTPKPTQSHLSRRIIASRGRMKATRPPIESSRRALSISGGYKAKYQSFVKVLNLNRPPESHPQRRIYLQRDIFLHKLLTMPPNGVHYMNQ